MRLYRLGDIGDTIRDLQERLRGLGFDPCDDEPGRYDDHTAGAVRDFQRARNLAVDGIIGPDTWRELVEAGYRLGDRLLYYRRPMLRGDDVSALQHLLNTLGFDTGKEDGVFGPNTQHGLVEFQRNRNLAEDGMAGPVVIRELALVGRAIGQGGREDVRERLWLRDRPAKVAGLAVYLDPFCREPDETEAAWRAATSAERVLRALGGLPVLSRPVDLFPPERVRARRANRLGVDLVVAFGLAREEPAAVYSFATARSRSEAGAGLAAVLAGHLGLPAAGRASPILKETRMPAVLVETSPLDDVLGKAVAHGLDAFFTAVHDDAGEGNRSTGAGQPANKAR